MRPDTNTDGDFMRRSLKRAAEDVRPEFSEDLHERVLGRIAADTAAGSLPVRVSEPSRMRFRAWQLVAALAVMLLMGVAWQWVRPQEPVQVAHVTSPESEVLPLVPVDLLEDRPMEEVAVAVEASMEESQWAWLDHDAALATEFFLGALPVEKPLLDETLMP